ncbi:MAG: hypothetical protein FWG87_07730 [Defluviitaleaceae bacterium]|nr:hypothetical protein [Defluviitaleaceae bacterium]
MNRFTEKNKDEYCVSDEKIKAAIQRLGVFEDAYDDLMGGQVQIAKDLEALRMQGKEKTVKFKEAMAQKLINSHIMMFFERYGVK